MDKYLVKASKLLSLVLRHKPEALGITLDAEGWASLEELVAQSKGALTRDIIEQAVAQNDKRRFTIAEDGTKIRANQGHSIAVDLNLSAKSPPNRLYHGTATRFLESVLENGLNAKGRNHVHLSLDFETAVLVGQRHGKPIVLAVDARAMAEAGQSFFLSENGVWLTDYVSPEFLSVLDK